MLRCLTVMSLRTEAAGAAWRVAALFVLVFLAGGVCSGCVSAGAQAPPALTVNDNLSSARFAALPAPVRLYLKELSRAWRTGDEAFLLAQGEDGYAESMRPRVRTSRYLALLYQAGPYTDSADWEYGVYDIVPDAIAGIQFLDYEEQGPVLVISARLLHKNGIFIPCTIHLLWRLLDIKIIGVS
jgi:hypothetical protein